jgi:selenide,water dikinase
VSDLPQSFDPSLLVGLAPFDDAAVYQVSEDVALVSTTDFFPPLVDDPADFGAIAAANACSDVFAMGGRVVLAVNIAAFPEHLPREVIAEIFASAAEVVAEAGGTIAGGHTIRNPEPIFGLAVQGVVDPRRVFRKSGAQPDDIALLSKPLGTGLVTAAGTNEQKLVAIDGMRRLNRLAAESLRVRMKGIFMRSLMSPDMDLLVTAGKWPIVQAHHLSFQLLISRCIPAHWMSHRPAFERAEIPVIVHTSKAR